MFSVLYINKRIKSIIITSERNAGLTVVGDGVQAKGGTLPHTFFVILPGGFPVCISVKFGDPIVLKNRNSIKPGYELRIVV